MSCLRIISIMLSTRLFLASNTHELNVFVLLLSSMSLLQCVENVCRDQDQGPILARYMCASRCIFLISFICILNWTSVHDFSHAHNLALNTCPFHHSFCNLRASALGKIYAQCWKGEDQMYQEVLCRKISHQLVSKLIKDIEF